MSRKQSSAVHLTSFVGGIAGDSGGRRKRFSPTRHSRHIIQKRGWCVRGGVDRILGVDFSGARDAGQKIWLTVGVERGGELHVKSSVPAGQQFGADSREECLAGLRSAIGKADVVGLDFPFGLPAVVCEHEEWRSVCRWIAEDVTDPDELQEVCVDRAKAATDGESAYLRRATDEPHGALSPYHWFTAAQTFYGVGNVLWPLLREGTIRIEPMGDGSGTPVCEIYPAGTLQDVGLPADRYKDDTDEARQRRETIVEGLRLTPLSLHGIEDHLIADVGGDAIDSLLAALAAWRASREGFEPSEPWDPLEGHIYV
ncbi:DUF429 domain-containing protein [Halapricum sp. CBA1109]|nr:DUF429 domain-containing protein [Halapricum sp. CBA1109]